MRIMPFMKRKKGVQFAGSGLDTGTSDYDVLSNKPQIGGVTLTGNKTLADLGAQSVLTFDDTPTPNSNNPVKSGGIVTALSKFGKLIVNGSADMDDYNMFLLILHDNFVEGLDSIQIVFRKGSAEYPYICGAPNSDLYYGFYRVEYDQVTRTISINYGRATTPSQNLPTVSAIYGLF